MKIYIYIYLFIYVCISILTYICMHVKVYNHREETLVNIYDYKYKTRKDICSFVKSHIYIYIYIYISNLSDINIQINFCFNIFNEELMQI